MNQAQTPKPDLDELAAMAVRLGRELARRAHEVYLGGNSRDFAIADRALRRLADRKPFDPRDDGSFAAIAGILDDDLRSEIIGTERYFVETHCDEHGVQGDVVECPVYSPRGMALLDLQRTFAGFVATRDAALDRIAADRALKRLLSS
ncbi:MAG: hypothetical protein NXH83_14725 [Rhodobacteraceae bacterium]|nr:hypothetical protein [Paracoccaceae bacterium]